MAVLVQKTFSTVCTGQLHQAIQDNVTIVTNLEQIVYAGGATTDFWFANALSGPEDTELDNILGSWSCAAEPVESGDGYLDDSNGPSTDILWSSDKITSDFVEIAGDDMTGDLKIQTEVRVKHPTIPDQDIIIQSGTGYSTIGSSISKPGTSGFLHIMPNAASVQWIIGDPASATGVNAFYWDVDEEGVMYLNTLPGAGRTGDVVATHTAALRPAADILSTLGGASFRWLTIYGQDVDLTGNITITGNVDGVDVGSPKGSIEVDSNQYQLDGDLASPGTDKLYGTNGSGVKGWYDIPAGASGEINTASNLGAGVGVFDGKVGVDLQFRSLVSQNTLLSITLDGANDEIDFTVNVGNIDHDSLLNTHNLTTDVDHDLTTNFVLNEHVDHTSVTLTAGLGLSGGGDISANRNFAVNVVNSVEISGDNVQLVGDAASPGNDKLYGTNGSGVKGWYDQPAGASGEINTASNLGAGVGVFDGKVGVDLQFRSLVSQNTLLSITLDGANDEIDFTVNVGNIDHDSLLNTHNLTTDINHNTILNNHNLTTDIDHDQLTNFVLNEHLDWTADQGANNIHDNNIVASSVTQHVGSIDHDQLLNYAAKEHASPKNSIEIDTLQLQLVGDAASPGNDKVYGTNGTGVKGWYDAPTSAVWGNITGTLSNQTDLQNALDAKAVSGGAEHDGFSDFVANEHIDHTSVTLTAGAGLAGGGDISANRTFSVNVQNSIEISTDTLQLVGDAASPGNNYVYGTDGAGTKGWKPDPAGGGGDVSAAANMVDNSIIRGDGGVKGVQDSDSLWTIADDGLMAGVVNRSGYGMTIRNNNATTGEFLRFIASDGSTSLEFNKNASEDGIWRAYMGVSGNAFFEADFGVVKIGDTANPPDANYELLIDHGVLGISNALDDKIGIQAPAGAFTDYTLTLPTSDGNLNEVLTTNGSGVLSWTAPGTGDVSGPGSSVDTRIPRWDGTTGTLLQNPDTGTDLFFTDAGEFNIVTDTTLYGMYITNTTAGGDFINCQNHNSNDLFLLTADGSGNGSLEVFTDAGGVVIAADSTGINTAGTYKIGGVTVNIPSGGIAGQVIEKVDGTDYNVQWATPTVYGDVSAAANMVDNSIIRGDGGVKGVQDSEQGTTTWTIADNGKLVGVGDNSGDYIMTVRNLNATSGDGFSVQAGEALGDLAFSIQDSDGSFIIMECEADQGYVTFGKSYAQTLTDNGVVYGVDIQNTNNPGSADFNTQAGQYRMAGDPIPLKTFCFFMDQVEFPRGTDWNVNVGAPASADSNNNSLIVRRFDDTTDEAIGFMICVPENAFQMKITTKARAETAPGVSQTAIAVLHKRQIPDNAAVGTWSTNALTNIVLPTNENFQYDVTSAGLGTWGLTAGSTYQMQFSRDANNVSDDLSGDLSLLEIEVVFS